MSTRPLLLTALAGLAAIALALLALNVTSNVIASGYVSARSIGDALVATGARVAFDIVLFLPVALLAAAVVARAISTLGWSPPPTLFVSLFALIGVVTAYLLGDWAGYIVLFNGAAVGSLAAVLVWRWRWPAQPAGIGLPTVFAIGIAVLMIGGLWMLRTPPEPVAHLGGPWYLAGSPSGTFVMESGPTYKALYRRTRGRYLRVARATDARYFAPDCAIYTVLGASSAWAVCGERTPVQLGKVHRWTGDEAFELATLDDGDAELRNAQTPEARTERALALAREQPPFRPRDARQ